MKEKIAENIRPHLNRRELSIEVTNVCNSSCLHCFARTGISRLKSLSVDIVKEIMDEGYEVGYRHLHITGGEPLLWEGLFEALDYGFAIGYETIFMNTNGTLVTEEVSNRFAAYRNFSLSISVDGPEAIHDRVRGKGSYRSAVKGIEKILNEGNNLRIFTTITGTLLPELPYFVDYLYRQFPTINCLILIQLLRITEDPFALLKDLIEPYDFIRLVQMVAFLNLGGYRTIVKKNPLANIVSKLLEMPFIHRVPPLYKEGNLIIMANKNVGFVHSNRKCFGKYQSGMIQNILSSARYSKAVAPDQTTCPSCKYIQLCRENNLIRPPRGYGDTINDTSYCKKVLDIVTSVQEESTIQFGQQGAESFLQDP